MKTTRFSESQIFAVLKQADAGIPIKDICRQAGISQATYYLWKSKYGGMEASDLKRVKELEAENAKLKRMYAVAASAVSLVPCSQLRLSGAIAISLLQAALALDGA